jgi:uncharacterized delta-60 repeat protein
MKKYALQFLISSIGLALASAAPNSLDPTFGAGTGKSATAVGAGNASISDLKVSSDGKILAAGTSNSGTSNDFELDRFNTDGTVDTTFGTAGRATLNFGLFGGNNDSIAGIAFHVNANSGVVAVGTTTSGATSTIALARYNLNVNGFADGTLDLNFGTTGTHAVELGVASGVVVDATQGILVSGTLNNKFVLYRYTAAGVLDATFGAGGMATVDFLAAETSTCVALQGAYILVGGYTYNSATGFTDFALARFLPNGALDNAFGAGGRVTARILGFDKLNSIVVQADGRIILAGSSGAGGISYFGIVRYNANGTLDGTFGYGSKLLTTFTAGSGVAAGYKVILQSDGSILVAGSASNGLNTDFALVRYSSNGTLDNSFNSLRTPALDSTGKVTTDIAGFNDEAHAVAVLPTGKIVLGGFSTPSAGAFTQFALTRYSGGSVSPFTYNASYGLLYNTGGLNPFGGNTYESTELGTLFFYPWPYQNFAFSTWLGGTLYGDSVTSTLYSTQYQGLSATADGDHWYYSANLGWLYTGPLNGAVYSLRFGLVFPYGNGINFYSPYYGVLTAKGNGVVYLNSYNRYSTN